MSLTGNKLSDDLKSNEEIDKVLKQSNLWRVKEMKKKILKETQPQ